MKRSAIDVSLKVCIPCFEQWANKSYFDFYWAQGKGIWHHIRSLNFICFFLKMGQINPSRQPLKYHLSGLLFHHTMMITSYCHNEYLVANKNIINATNSGKPKLTKLSFYNWIFEPAALFGPLLPKWRWTDAKFQQNDQAAPWTTLLPFFNWLPVCTWLSFYCFPIFCSCLFDDSGLHGK